MKQLIAIFLLVFGMASCQPKCDCSQCVEQNKVETTLDSTVVDTTVAPVETETSVEKVEGTEK